MNSKIKKIKIVQEFPKLMTIVECGLVVLFVNDNYGFVVNTNHYYTTIGYSSENWTIADFEPFNDELILKN